MLFKPYYRLFPDWAVSGDFLDEARRHLATKSITDDLVIDLVKSALDDLDGIDGRLNESIIIRPIIQNFERLNQRLIPLWGQNISDTPAPVIRYREGNSDNLSGVINRGIELYQNKILINQDDYNTIVSAIEPNIDPYRHNVQVDYYAGIATELVSLPADLKAVIFGLARRKFDYRDSYIYDKYPEDKWLERTIKKYRARPVDYPY